jgi:hypothetical protein
MDLEEIKQSKVNPTEKKVLLWTPVVLGRQFPTHVQKFKLEYTTGEALNRQDFPKEQLQNLAGGVILDLPLAGIRDTL